MRVCLLKNRAFDQSVDSNALNSSTSMKTREPAIVCSAIEAFLTDLVKLSFV